MKPTVIFRPEAVADVNSARRWYENQQVGLGRQFAQSLSATVRRVQGMPKMYLSVAQDVRRAKLRKFPYVVYYRFIRDTIEVLAVLHGSRRPAIWQDRNP